MKPLAPGTIKLDGVLKENQPILSGVVIRPLRSLNPDQKEYAGLIQEVSGGQYKIRIDLGFFSWIANLTDVVFIFDSGWR